MLKTLKCHKCELNFEFLYHLHHRHVIDEQKYLQKKIKSIIDGGLWDDFIVVFGYQSICNTKFMYEIIIMD